MLIQTIQFRIIINFVHMQLNVNTVLYQTIQSSISTVSLQTIQFNISMQFKCKYTVYMQKNKQHFYSKLSSLVKHF